MNKALIVSFFTLYSVLCTLCSSHADTIETNNGKELKGIVVEEYKDRIIMSTADGEVSVPKSDVKELYYDTEEQNLIKLGEQARDKSDYIKSFVYYDKAFKMNPNSRQAKDGIVFLQGYLFKKDMAQKEEIIRHHNEFEQKGEQTVIKSEEEKFNDELRRLKNSAGIVLSSKGGITSIESVRPSSPAYEAGVRKGDVLISVWGRLVGYMSLPEVVETLSEKTSLETKIVIERGVDIDISKNRNIMSNVDELIGAVLSMQFEGLTVSSLKESAPTTPDGLKAGDLIVDVNDNPTRYMTLKRAEEIIKKTKGNTVNLTIRREVVMWGKEGI